MIYRGIKASELIKQLQEYINKYGDFYMYKEYKGDLFPLKYLNHYPDTDYFELT